MKGKDWEMREIVGRLKRVRRETVGCISLNIRPDQSLSSVLKLLTNELNFTCSYKARATRTSLTHIIQAAITTIQRYNSTPKNGLAVYISEISDDKGEITEIIDVDFEPILPIKESLYVVDRVFDVREIEAMVSSEGYGVVVIDISSTYIGICTHTQREIIQKIHCNGSVSRYISTIESAVFANFHPNDHFLISRLIIALTPLARKFNLEEELNLAPFREIVSRVEVTYGGFNGFSQGVEMVISQEMRQEREQVI